MNKGIPEGFPNVIPSLVSRNAAAAIELYKRALGAKEEHRLLNPDTGKVGHACISVGNSRIFIYDENPQMGCVAPGTQGSSVNFYLYVDNVDSAYKTALGAGFKEIMPVADMFWGDRMGCVIDPDGYRWSLATHVREVSPADMEKGMKEMCTANKAA